jgi:hypothetical protein
MSKNMYILKVLLVLLNVVTAGIEALVILYACVKEVCHL